MADDGSKLSKKLSRISKFYFLVDLGGGMKEASFQEVSGLDVEAQIIEYRQQGSPVFSNQGMPGLAKFGNITLKKGVLIKDNQFFDWYTTIKMNTVKRVNVTIKLLDQGGNSTMTWVLQNAWPTKVTGTDLRSDGNEVAIETIEIAHEGLVISNA
ncbi:phage tail protein [Mariniflexile sp. AS56]|uniref:phage tail protein n=1 Tax=Mariniflexile sp. AS56 TaxID=3063957 RepID=UPI0026EA7298|nr:phage tail protein [Mariniflexile sp. AS56]MDO7173702.1 phage tail protein [Mariniflexile sp. AS56]